MGYRNPASYDLSATSPSAQSTVAGPVAAGLENVDSLLILASLTGATGGVLDVYLQTSADGGASWYDYAHFAQKAAGSGVTHHLFSVSRHAQQLTITTVGKDTTPALPANTVVGGSFGDRLRVLFVAGSGTSGGAAQTIELIVAWPP